MFVSLGEKVMEAELPWFQEGLAFTCTQCGNCCTGDPGFVWVNDREITEIAGFVGVPEREIREFYGKKGPKGITLREKPNGDCVFFDRGRGCVIYEVRPTQCRTWPFWEGNIETPETWEKTCQICPGSGQGQLIKVEEILTRARLTKV